MKVYKSRYSTEHYLVPDGVDVEPRDYMDFDSYIDGYLVRAHIAKPRKYRCFNFVRDYTIVPPDKIPPTIRTAILGLGRGRDA